MSLELIVIHALFIGACAGGSYCWGWVNGIRAHRDYLLEKSEEES
ncbi:MAG: hypothetical protein VW270_15675 [Candidatus Poseidoniales archaeon]